MGHFQKKKSSKHCIILAATNNNYAYHAETFRKCWLTGVVEGAWRKEMNKHA